VFLLGLTINGQFVASTLTAFKLLHFEVDLKVCNPILYATG
jgi:hypothetical protein